MGIDQAGQSSGKNSPPDQTIQEVAQHKALADLRNRAYGYLARREHSAHELKKKLDRFDEYGQIVELIKELNSQNAQSDLRFAEQIGRVRVAAGKGPMVLQQELEQNRIDSVIIEGVMAIYEGEWTALAEQARQKKFGAAEPENYSQWAKHARFLQQRGFTANEIPPYRP